MTLVEFLLARITEDEQKAASAGHHWEVADERKVRWTAHGGDAHGWVAFTDIPPATEHTDRI